MRPKREMSGADVRAIIAESEDLAGARIDKIYELSKGVMLFRLRGKERKATILVDPKGFFFLDEGERVTPTTPSSFAMFLRKYISGGRVNEIHQHRFDRSILLEISTGAGNFTLVIELFGGGNIVLVQDDRILRPLFHRTWRHRTIRPGKEFLFPPDWPDPTELEEEEFVDILRVADRDVVRTLTMNANLGGEIAEDICDAVGIDRNIPCQDLSEDQMKALYAQWKTVFKSFSDPQPYVAGGETPSGFSFLPLARYSDTEKQPFLSLSNAVQFYYDNMPKEQKKTSSETKREKLQRQLDQQLQAIEEFREEEIHAKRQAEAIYIEYSPLQKLLSGIQSALEQGYEWEEIRNEVITQPRVSDLDPAERRLYLKVEDQNGELELSLDVRISVDENASRYYDLGKKIKEKSRGAVRAVEDTKKLMEKVSEEEQIEARKAEKRKTFWFERYRWFLTSEGNLVIAGRDAETNDRIVKRHMKDGDRYVHGDIHGAPSTIIKAEGDIGEDSLLEACHFSIIHSKAWNAKIGSAEAYWVKPDQVSKTPNPGEFLARGAFVIRGKRHYHHNLSLRACVCMANYQGVEMVMCCPPERVINESRYLVLEPGDEQKSAVAKQVASLFSIPVDEAMRILPPGKSRIVEKKGL